LSKSKQREGNADGDFPADRPQAEFPVRGEIDSERDGRGQQAHPPIGEKSDQRQQYRDPCKTGHETRQDGHG
jgi:hypothetical protein